MYKIKNIFPAVSVIVFAGILFILAISCGTVDIGFTNTVKILVQICTGNDTVDILNDVIYYLRIPRLILAGLIGCGLSITGCVMQAIMQNPLADPYLLGISSGAGLGAVLSIILGLTSFLGMDAIGFFAFAGALAVTVFIIFISFRFKSAGTTSILLSGMALNAVCAACISLLINVFADAERIQNVTFWLMGSLQNAAWSNIIVLAFVVCLITVYFIKNSRILNLMLLGDNVSITLGYDLSVKRRIYVLLCSFVVGLIVYNSGIIGFIGLIVPHIARLLCGSNYKKILPLSAVIGIIFMALADVASRTVMDGSEVPIGIVVSVIGAPLFIYLLMSRNYGYNRK